MLTLYSFLQNVFLFVKTVAVKVTKRTYRSAAVFVSAASVITVVALTSSGFGSGGKNMLVAFAETNSGEPENTEEEEPEETELLTEAKIQVDLTDSRRQGQQFVGQMLTQDVQRQEESRIAAQAEIEEVKKQILMEAETARKKAEEEAKRAAAVVAYSDEDYQVLLRIVQAEAGICDDKGKILVANVIINRVKNSEFPNTIKSVVYEKSQFSPVSNGSINTVKVTRQTIDCVDRALQGEDYSQGALYFMYRGGSRSGAIRWFDRHLTFLFSHKIVNEPGLEFIKVPGSFL